MNKFNVPGMFWAANRMQPMQRGLVLANGGYIGQQGYLQNANGNQWQGTWYGSSTFTTAQTFVDGLSDAANSQLYVNSGAQTTPTINLTVSPPLGFGAGNIIASIGSVYNCSGMVNGRSIPFPDVFLTENLRHNAEYALYRFLHVNDSIRDNEPYLSDFYYNSEGSMLNKFIQVEQYLNEGNTSDARSVLSLIDDTLSAQSNQKLFYSLYADYLDAVDGKDTFGESDSTDLAGLASHCPELEGFGVYQARALFNTIFGFYINGESCINESGARFALNGNLGEKNKIINKPEMAIHVFPNPAASEVSILSETSLKSSRLIITDLAGRVLSEEIITDDVKQYVLPLTLGSGCYILRVLPVSGREITTKILISK
jgi:hypothetical protein